MLNENSNLEDVLIALGDGHGLEVGFYDWYFYHIYKSRIDKNEDGTYIDYIAEWEIGKPLGEQSKETQETIQSLLDM